jgi:apolipoprotein N-acyltransferase
MTASHFTFNIDVLGWVAMVPFLIYLKASRGWKSRVLFALVLLLSWTMIVSKIITDPISPVLCIAAPTFKIACS